MRTSFLSTVTDKPAFEGHLGSSLSLRITNIPSARQLHEHLAHPVFGSIKIQLTLGLVALEPSECLSL